MASSCAQLANEPVNQNACESSPVQACCGCAAILQLFGGILTQKRRAEVALLQSGMNYVIVRPGGMERPTDAYKRTHNVVLAKQDTRFGGQVRVRSVRITHAC